MNNKSIKSALLFSGLIFNSTACAYMHSSHVVGGHLGGIGTQSYDMSQTIENEYEIVNMNMAGDLYYRYMLNQNFGIEAGLMAGGGAGILNWLGFTDVKNFHYLAGRTALHANLPLFLNTNLYGKLGGTAVRIGYEIDEKETDKTEYGLYGALGLEYRFNFGLGLNIQYQYIGTSNFDTESLLFGASYAF